MSRIARRLEAVVCGFCLIAFAPRPLDAGPLGLPASPTGSLPDENKIALGRKLFFDTRLSADGKVSCASCHRPEAAFVDGRALAVGVEGRRGTRNTPTLLNAAFHASQFWDGRRGSLEEQVLDPLVNPVEHGLADHAAVVSIVSADPAYRAGFEAAFGPQARRVTEEHVARALASFVRSLVAADSPFDRYLYGGKSAALSDAAIRGLALFQGRARCVECHTIGEREATFSDNRFHRVGVGLDRIGQKLASVASRVAGLSKDGAESLAILDPDVAALGRFLVTRNPADIGKFRTPTLRNVALTAPYMHDGSLASLEEAIDWELYQRVQPHGRPIILTPGERADLLVFLRSLTSAAPTRHSND